MDQSANPERAKTLALRRFIDEHVQGSWYTWAMDNYKPTIIAIIRNFGCRSVMEIGGGRSPLLTEDEVRALGIRYTVNDISQHELDLCPSWADKMCFDIAGPSCPPGSFDLAFSRMVLEHVRHGGRAYENIFRLLVPGGIGLHFHPTLFAPPFIINYLLPDGLSRKVLSVAGLRLTDTQVEYPKFPAYYSWCRSTSKVRQQIRAIGFADVQLASFFGHGYFRKVPGLRVVDDWLSTAAQRRNLGWYTSYSYTIVQR